MILILAVNTGNTEVVFGKTCPMYVYFEATDRERAEKYANKIGSEVEEWIASYRDFGELTFMED